LTIEIIPLAPMKRCQRESSRLWTASVLFVSSVVGSTRYGSISGATSTKYRRIRFMPCW
jgi:hypothetical protein